MDKHKTPGERFKEFFESTTLSVREFANEIGHPGSYRSLYAVFKGDRAPSSKLSKALSEDTHNFHLTGYLSELERCSMKASLIICSQW